MTRYLLFATAAALILAAGVVGLLPSRYTVERSIVVKADADDIVPLVAAFPRRQAWIPWTSTRSAPTAS